MSPIGFAFKENLALQVSSHKLRLLSGIRQASSANAACLIKMHGAGIKATVSANRCRCFYRHICCGIWEAQDLNVPLLVIC